MFFALRDFFFSHLETLFFSHLQIFFLPHLPRAGQTCLFSPSGCQCDSSQVTAADDLQSTKVTRERVLVVDKLLCRHTAEGAGKHCEAKSSGLHNHVRRFLAVRNTCVVDDVCVGSGGKGGHEDLSVRRQTGHGSKSCWHVRSLFKMLSIGAYRIVPRGTPNTRVVTVFSAFTASSAKLTMRSIMV